MIRILFFLIVIFCLGLGFAWLADRPGELVMTLGGYQYQVSLMVAAVAIVAIVATTMIAWWVLKSLWNSPRAVGRYFRSRRRDRGYQSLSTGLIAAGSGDNGLARRMGKQASGLLNSDQEPLLHLLNAQTLLLEGRHDDARATFEAMVDDPETRLLGLRGLYLEAQRLGEREAARHYAEQAAEAAPQLTWAANAAIETRTIEGDWAGALRLVESQSATKQITREEAARRRAVLLTARSMAEFDTNPAESRSAALEANKLAPDFVPAAMAAGRALYRDNDIRKGSRILEATWKKEPHPEIADIYIHARQGDSTHDRLKRARRLESLKKNNVESCLALARAAFEADEYREARKAIESALRLQPRESAYLLLADIEETETGDQGRVRHWLAKAVRAPRDPAWTADGYVSEKWAPISPITGAIDAFEWRVPVERIGPVIEPDMASDDPEIPIIPLPPAVMAVDSPPDLAGDIAKPDTEETPPPADKPDQAGGSAEDDVAKAENEDIPKPPEPAPTFPQKNAKADESDKQKSPLHRIADDPGVNDDTPDQRNDGRFRLF